MPICRFLYLALVQLLIMTEASAITLQFNNLQAFQLDSPTTLNNKQLGSALALSDSIAAVSASENSSNSSGSVYLYSSDNNWSLINEISSQSSVDNFARHLALSNDLLVISADQDDEKGKDSGAVYIFQQDDTTALNNWRLVTKLTAPDAQANDHFGHSIYLINQTLYVGAPQHSQGKVYIFTYDTASSQWLFNTDISPTDPLAMGFGASIAQDQQTLIIGAPYTDADNTALVSTKSKSSPYRDARFAISKGDTFDPGIESGAIYVYENTSNVWVQSTRLGSTSRETGDHLGEQIAIENNYIIAEVNQKDVFDDLRAGEVYIYKKTNGTWHENTALMADTPNVGASFGTSFSILDGHILVGAPKTHANGFNSGQAYLFTQDNNGAWPLITHPTVSELVAHDQFGTSVALGTAHMLISSKKGTYVLHNKAPEHNIPAIFYQETNVLQLNALDVPGIGVFSATLTLNIERLSLSLTASQLRTNISASPVSYSIETGTLVIPSLIIQDQDGTRTKASITLQRDTNSSTLQFKITSFQPSTP